MKIVITIAIVLLALSCFAQSETSASKWQITALLLPQYCAYQNTSETADGKYAATRTFGIAYSLALTRTLANNWAVGTEILYSQQTQNYEPNISLTQSVANYQRAFEFVKIPFFIQKNLKINKNTVFKAGIGVQTDILAKAEYYKDANILYTNTFDGSTERVIYQPINISAAAKIGSTFRANSRLSVCLYVRYDATLLNPDKVENEYWRTTAGSINKIYAPTQPRSRSQLTTLGLGLGIQYDL
jgi:hypothetical protein